MKETTRARVIHSIYESVENPTRWQQVLADLCDNFNAQQAVLWRKDSTGKQVLAHFSHNVDRRYERQYRQHFHTVDVRAQALEQRAPGRGYASHTIFPDKEYLKSEIYNDFCKPQDTRHTLETTVLPQHSGQQVHLGLHRGHDFQPFEEEAVTAINRLLPHITQSVQLAEVLSRSSDENVALQGAIEHLADAVAVCDMDRQPLHQNRALIELMELRGLVRTNSRGCLMFIDADHQGQFEALLRETIGSATRGSSFGAPRSVQIQTRDQRYVVRVAPWIPATSNAYSSAQAPGFVVFIREIQQRKAPIAENIVAAHHLTRSEGEIGKFLCQGLSPADIADQRGVATSTVQQQIKTMMRKLHCHTRAELVALLLTNS
jgi:DNA-binding NarL/FixJ family response regulator